MLMCLNDFKGWSKFDYAWLFTAMLIIIGIPLYMSKGEITPMLLLGIASSIYNVLCVILVGHKKLSNFYYGAIGVVLYAYMAYSAKLYGDVMLNVIYYFPTNIIGYFIWKKNADKQHDDTNEVVVKYMTNSERCLIAIGSIVCICVYSILLKYLGGNVPYLDSTSTVLSVIGMALLMFGYAEQWCAWIAVNCVSIAMWYSVYTQGGDGIESLLMWIVFLINSLIGYYKWRKIQK
ncbi:MAG: nicotinamide riboside transporter PnuC [Cetobacterium somerae]